MAFTYWDTDVIDHNSVALNGLNEIYVHHKGFMNPNKLDLRKLVHEVLKTKKG